MDQREKMNDPQETLRLAIAGALLGVSTMCPVEIVSFNSAGDNTADVQPVQKTIRLLAPNENPAQLPKTSVLDPDGEHVWEQPAMLIKCPVFFLSGGNYTVISPPVPGQAAIAIFSHRSIDDWWVAGGIQKRTDLRSHHASDAIVLCGVNALPNAIAGIDPAALEIRSADGTTSFKLGAAGVVTLTAPGGFNVTGKVIASELGTTQIPTPGSTTSTASIPIVLNGVTWYMRLSSAP